MINFEPFPSGNCRFGSIAQVWEAHLAAVQQNIGNEPTNGGWPDSDQGVDYKDLGAAPAAPNMWGMGTPQMMGAVPGGMPGGQPQPGRMPMMQAQAPAFQPQGVRDVGPDPAMMAGMGGGPGNPQMAQFQRPPNPAQGGQMGQYQQQMYYQQMMMQQPQQQQGGPRGWAQPGQQPPQPPQQQQPQMMMGFNQGFGSDAGAWDTQQQMPFQPNPMMPGMGMNPGVMGQLGGMPGNMGGPRPMGHDPTQPH